MTDVIAEVGLQHDGSLREAMAFARACAENGIGCVKYQCHLADENLAFRPGTEHFFPQDKTRFDYWQRTNFTPEEWARLKEYCDALRIEFLCTPFSIAAAEMLNPLVKRWKIGSGLNQNSQLFKWLADTKKPFIISSGDPDSPDGIRCPDLFREAINIVAVNFGVEDITVLKCISKYPTTTEEAGAFCASTKYREFSRCYMYQSGSVFEPIVRGWGWSDHTGNTLTAIDAVNYGASIIEMHVVWNKAQGGPDVSSAVTVEELAHVARYAKQEDAKRSDEADRQERVRREHAAAMALQEANA